MNDDFDDVSDSIDGTHTPPGKEFAAFLATRRSGLETAEFKQRDGQDENDHKFIEPTLNIEYAYGLETIQMDGETYYQYGITASRKAKETGYKLEGFILHHTSDGRYDSMLNYISKVDRYRGEGGKEGKGKNQFGYHFLVGRNGLITQAAPLHKRTNHIKPGSHPERVALNHLENHNTLGISLHAGYTKKDGVDYHQPASEKQLEAAHQLVIALSKKFGVSLDNCWGHGELQKDKMLSEAHELVHKCKNLPPYSATFE